MKQNFNRDLIKISVFGADLLRQQNVDSS